MLMKRIIRRGEVWNVLVPVDSARGDERLIQTANWSRGVGWTCIVASLMLLLCFGLVCVAQDFPPTQRLTLDNGLTLLHRYNPTGQTVGIAAFVEVPADVETPQSAGLRSITQQMLLHRPADETGRTPSQKLANLGATVDTRVHADCTQLTVASLAEHYDECLPILREVLFSNQFEWTALRDIQSRNRQQLIDSSENPAGVAEIVGYSKLFENSACRWPEAGTTAGIAAADSRSVLRLHNYFWRPNRVVLSISGPLRFDECKRSVLSTFSALMPGPGEAIEAQTSTSRDGPTYMYQRWPTDNATIGLYTDAPGPVTQQHAAMSTLAAILGGGESSRLWQTLRDERGLVYGVRAQVSLAKRCPTFQIVANCSAGDVAEVAEIITRSVREAIAEPPEDRELQRAKDYLLGNHVISLQHNLHAAILMGLFEVVSEGSGPQAQAFLERALEEVTPRDVHNVACQYLPHAVWIQVGGRSCWTR
ncbi:MAG: M16 family metallopeptidase [Armatimonadota bacterium]